MEKDISKKLYNFLSPSDKEVKADLIIGFGHFDLRIARYCALSFKKNLAPIILFTGGIGDGSGDFKNTEAEKFKNYLLNYYPEINSENVLIEKESTNTGENIKNSIEILKKRKLFDAIGTFIFLPTLKPMRNKKSLI